MVPSDGPAADRGDPMRGVAAKVIVVAISATMLLSGPALAWEGRGHTVIEALAYRTLVEGTAARLPAPTCSAT